MEMSSRQLNIHIYLQLSSKGRGNESFKLILIQQSPLSIYHIFFKFHIVYIYNFNWRLITLQYCGGFEHIPHLRHYVGLFNGSAMREGQIKICG